MVFSPATLEILPHIRKYVPLFPYRLSKNAKGVLQNLCKRIHASVKQVPTFTSVPIDNMPEFMATAKGYRLYDSIPKVIRSQIETSDKKGATYTFAIHCRTATVHLVLPKPSTHPSEYSRIYESDNVRTEFFDKCIYRIAVWLGIAFSVAGTTCANHLTCYLFFTDHTKQLPTEDTRSTEDTASPIDTVHANTAFTTSCTPDSTIVLYRMEEWFKVFLHESFHSLGLDFSEMDATESNQQIIRMFPGCSRGLDVRLFEVYSEMWAEIWNVLFIAYDEATRSRSSGTQKSGVSKISVLRSEATGKRSETRRKIIDKTIDRVEHYLKYERTYTMFQASKILHHYNITYPDLCKETHRKHQYAELTPVFSYYILKSVLFYHLDEFLEWCKQHNPSILYFTKTQENIREYGDLVGRYYQSEEFVQKMAMMEKKHHGLSHGTLANTLRMTLYETREVFRTRSGRNTRKLLRT